MRCEHPFLEDNGSSYLSRCRPPRRRRARVNRKMWRPKTITDSSARCISGRIVSREQSFPPRPGKGRIVLSLRIVYRREWRRESPRDDQEAVKFKDPRRSLSCRFYDTRCFCNRRLKTASIFPLTAPPFDGRSKPHRLQASK